MIHLKKLISVFAGFFIFSGASSEEKSKIHMLLDKGLVIIKTYPEKAQNCKKNY